MNKIYKMFVDDLRMPIDDTWIIVRTYHEAINVMKHCGCPIVISFDHDLGLEDDGSEAKSGKDVANWLVEQDLDYPGFIPDDFKFIVHSANPVGKRNIEELLNNYLKQR